MSSNLTPQAILVPAMAVLLACVRPSPLPSDSDHSNISSHSTTSSTGASSEHGHEVDAGEDTSTFTTENNSTSTSDSTSSDSDTQSGTDSSATSTLDSDSSSNSSSDTSTGADADADSSSTSTTNEMGCHDNMDCLDPELPFCDPTSGICYSCTRDEHCPGDLHACKNHVCVECTHDLHCIGDPDGPICSNETCVACTEDLHCKNNLDGRVCLEKNCVECMLDEHCTDPEKPICNLKTHHCEIFCTELRDQCPGQAACDLNEGRCLPPNQVWYVDASNAACDDQGLGNSTQPFCRIVRAITKIENSQEQSGTIYISGDKIYQETVTIKTNPTGSIALLGDRIATIRGSDDLDANGIKAYGYGSLYLSRLNISSANNHGIHCSTDLLWGEELTLSHNANNGIYLLNIVDFSSITLHRTQVIENGQFGIEGFGNNSINLENTIIGRNGDNKTRFAGGLYIGKSGRASLTYVTIVDNQNDGTTLGKSIHCHENSDGSTMRNSIMLSNGEKSIVGCKQLKVTFSAIDDRTDLDPSSNKFLDPLPSLNQLFVDPHHLSSPDYRLQKSGQGAIDTWLKDVAIRQVDDPKSDFEGKERPSAGQPDWPGADMADSSN